MCLCLIDDPIRPLIYVRRGVTFGNAKYILIVSLFGWYTRTQDQISLRTNSKMLSQEKKRTRMSGITAIVRDAPLGQLLRYATNNRVLKYPEELGDFDCPLGYGANDGEPREPADIQPH